MVGNFSRWVGGLPDFKTFEELFCFGLDIFSRKGGYLIARMLRNFFRLDFIHFPTKIGEDDQNQTTLRNFSLYKIGFQKVPQRVPKIQGGGRLQEIQTEADIFSGWLPLP